MCENTLLSYFNPEWDTEVIGDGSPTGVDGILTQLNPENKEKKVIAYVSRSLTDAETRYGQIEREALAIHFACLKFQIYLLGKPFTMFTDDKPLEYMFNKPKTQMLYRIERIRVKLQGFNFTVKHLPGSKNPTDYISRKPIELKQKDKQTSKELEKHVYFIVNEGLPEAVTLKEIEECTHIDEETKALFQSIKNGFINEQLNPEIMKYKRIFPELSIVDGVILKGHKIVVPRLLRTRILEAGHDGHQGIVKTKGLVRSKAWYPGIDDDITKMVSNCRGCQTSVNDTSREPLIMSELIMSELIMSELIMSELIMSELPNAPWESLVTDY